MCVEQRPRVEISNCFAIVKTVFEVETPRRSCLFHLILVRNSDISSVAGEHRVIRAVMVDHLMGRMVRGVVNVELMIAEVDDIVVCQSADSVRGNRLRSV